MARLARLESQLALVLQRTIPVTTQITVRELSQYAQGWERRSTAGAVQELRDIALRLSNGAPATRAIRRDVRVIVEKLGARGMIDLRGETARAMRTVGAKVSDFLPDPQRFLIADAQWYEAKTAQIVDRLYLRNFDVARELTLRGLESGISRADIGERMLAEGLYPSRAIARTAARNFTTSFYNYGRLRVGSAAPDVIWGYEYAVIEDDQTTEICLALIGMTVAQADLSMVPPLHHGCRTDLLALMQPQFGGEEYTTTVPNDVEPQQGFGYNPLQELPSEAVGIKAR